MTNTDLKSFIEASLAKDKSGTSRASESYDKAAKLLLKLAKARKWSFFNLADFYASLESSELTDGSTIKYGFKNFRVRYIYPKTGKIINGTMTNALTRAGKYYFCSTGSDILIVPVSKFPELKKKLEKDAPEFIQLLEANYKAMYPSTKLDAVKAALATATMDELEQVEAATVKLADKAKK